MTVTNLINLALLNERIAPDVCPYNTERATFQLVLVLLTLNRA